MKQVETHIKLITFNVIKYNGRICTTEVTCKLYGKIIKFIVEDNNALELYQDKYLNWHLN